jgi:putative transposase
LNYPLNRLYQEAEISKQAVEQYQKRQVLFDEQVKQLILEANELRSEHPGCGVEKMYYTLKPDFIGRDRFVDLFIELGYRLKRQKNYRRTTIGSKLYYPNLIKGMLIDGPSQLWQSDITYIEVGGRFYYAVFIIDVYSKKIVGYQVSDHMRATANIRALEMALRSHKAPLIHHSDRGSQYTYKEYVDILKSCNCSISMALSAQDNAYAERINGTIKEEYLKFWKPKNFIQLKYHIKKAVKNYNQKRIHNGIKKLTPKKVEELYLTSQVSPSLNITIFNNEIN